MDYEEALLQVTDVLKANNRYRLGDFEQAVKLIREIVTPKGHWVERGNYTYCSNCNAQENDAFPNYCWNCGARMER